MRKFFQSARYETFCFCIAILAIAVLSFAGGWIAKGLSTRADLEGAAISAPLPAPAPTGTPSMGLPDNVVALEVGPREDGLCMVLVAGPNNEPDYVTRPCPKDGPVFQP